MNHKMTCVAKKLDILANIVEKITAAAGITCILVAALTLLFGSQMFAETAITLDLDFIRFHLCDPSYINEEFLKLYVITATLTGSILCFLVAYIAKLFRNILSPMKIGRPFERGIPENLRKIGWIVLIGGFLSELLGIIGRILLLEAYSMKELFVSAAISKTEFMFTINTNFVLIACILFFLSYIFSYGQLLQQDSDETL